MAWHNTLFQISFQNFMTAAAYQPHYDPHERSSNGTSTAANYLHNFPPMLKYFKKNKKWKKETKLKSDRSSKTPVVQARYGWYLYRICRDPNALQMHQLYALHAFLLVQAEQR
jgi:hypothetical protein